MRILVCAAAAPLSPTTGFTLVLVALLREFRQRHEVRTIAYRLPGQSGTPPPDVRLLPVRQGESWELAAIARGRPRFASRLTSEMRDAVHAELSRFDPEVVAVLSGRLGELGRDLDRHPSVVVPLDAAHLGIATRRQASRGLKRLLLQMEERRVRDFEATEYSRFDRVVVVSERDREALATLNPRLQVEVIPNGVDADFYAPDPSVSPDPARIVFTGVMSSPGNIVAAEFAARHVLPLIRNVRLDARLALVGRAPHSRVCGLASLDGVEVTGEVPDVRPWLTGSRAFLCPMMTGTGIKNKLLEAMAAGLPCVTTPLGLGGLDVEHGRELLVADTAESLAAHLLHVLADDGLAARLGRSARAYVRARHSWVVTARRYEGLFEQVRE